MNTFTTSSNNREDAPSAAVSPEGDMVEVTMFVERDLLHNRHENTREDRLQSRTNAVAPSQEPVQVPDPSVIGNHPGAPWNLRHGNRQTNNLRNAAVLPSLPTPRISPPPPRIQRLSHTTGPSVPYGTYTVPATATEPEKTLPVAGGDQYTCVRQVLLKRRLLQHKEILSFFDPKYNRMRFPDILKKSISLSDGRVLVWFGFYNSEDMLVHIQLCTQYTRREATRDGKVLASEEGDEIVKWSKVGPPSEREIGMWKVQHLIRATQNKVQVRWMGGQVSWVKRKHLSPALRRQVAPIIRRYREQRAQGLAINECDLA
jgi:hypothetical protein